MPHHIMPSWAAKESSEMARNNPKSITTNSSITFDLFDAFLDTATNVTAFNKEPYWPSMADIKFYEDELPTLRLQLFLTWLLEANGEPATEQDKQRRADIQQYLRDRLQIGDSVGGQTANAL